MKDLVVTVLGPDRPGLVEAVADVVAAHGGNWLESRMAHLAGKFAGVLRVEIPAERTASLVTALGALESRGLRVQAEESARPAAPASERVMHLDFMGLDRPGLVREISQLLAQHGVNVEELTTGRSSAPMSGEMLFSAHARVHLPADADLGRLRAGLERLANDLMVEIRLAAPAPS